MQMQASNLALALSEAIKAREHAERGLGYSGPSALLQGWRDVLAALARGEPVEIVTGRDGGSF